MGKEEWMNKMVSEMPFMLGEQKPYLLECLNLFASQEVAAEKQRWVEKIEIWINATKGNLDKYGPETSRMLNHKIDILNQLLEGEK